MIDAYKRVLVGQYEVPEDQENERFVDDPNLREAAGKALDGGQGDRTVCRGGASVHGENASVPVEGINPDRLEYGTKQARIVEYYLTDDRGVRTTAVIKGTRFTLHMRVEFSDYIPAPIFAFSVKNVKGTEITGTNTMLEKAFLESVDAGQKKEITFTQKMSLQGGEYLLSLGVTGYNGDTFEVYHRLYDVMNVTVVSDKDTVGYYDCESEVTVI